MGQNCAFAKCLFALGEERSVHSPRYHQKMPKWRTEVATKRKKMPQATGSSGNLVWNSENFRNSSEPDRI